MYIVYSNIYKCCTCIYIYNTILWPHHLTQPKFTHTSKSVWNVIFQAVLYGPWSRRNCNCVDSKLSDLFKDILYQEDSYKFLMSTRNLGFRLLGFHHWVQWRGAKTVSKECWGPCHGLIPSLWDFAQNYSPQIERRDQNWRGTIYPLDSEKAIEPCISAVTDCQPRFAQGQPNGYFQMKELDRITGVPMNERWRRLNANTSQTQYVLLCANLASHQLCRERQPLWKSHES